MSNEPQPFLIEGPEKQRYELTDADYFVSHYKPQGYRIVDPAPTGYVVPDLDAPPIPKPDKMTRAELNAYAATLGIEGAEAFPNKESLLIAVNAAATAQSFPVPLTGHLPDYTIDPAVLEQTGPVTLGGGTPPAEDEAN